MRPVDYPSLTEYKPSKFMLETSHYDKEKADRAVKFIEMLKHTKGKWAGSQFWLLPWQEQIVRDIFGIVKANGSFVLRMSRYLRRINSVPSCSNAAMQTHRIAGTP